MTIPNKTAGKVLIREPTHSIAYKDVDQYHRGGKNSKGFKCSVTKKVHTHQEVFPPYSYWLLVFPEGLCFDNLVFSNDQVKVQSHSIADSVTGIKSIA
jgi:hypothetical protein